VDLYIHPPICLHGVVFNSLSIGTTLPFNSHFTNFYISINNPITDASIQLVPGALSSEIKRQGREVDHSAPSRAEIKKGRAIPPLPHMPSQHSA
jgi:hypothetical protein